jgi:hypothetical protein
MKKSDPRKRDSPSRLIDGRIKELGDWRGETLSRIRTLIKQADPEVVEEWKSRGIPVWSHDGLICTGETYKNVVKMTFFKGASLKDPSGLFNSRDLSMPRSKGKAHLPLSRPHHHGDPLRPHLLRVPQDQSQPRYLCLRNELLPMCPE